MRAHTTTAVLVAVALATTGARAQNAEVEQLLRHGIELRQRGDDASALGEFQRAWQLAGTPRTLAQVALCEQAMGRWIDAETHLREALRAESDPWITRNRQALDAALGVIAQHVGMLLAVSDAQGAELLVDDRPVGRLPLDAPLRLGAGEYQVTARLGARATSQRVVVAAGETARVELRLGVPAPVVVTPPTTPPRTPPVEMPRPGGAQRAMGWVSLAVGAVGVGVGVWGLTYREEAAGQYNDSPCPGSLSAAQPGVCGTWLDRVTTGETMAWAGLLGGSVLAVAGVILVATAPSRAPRPAVTLRCAPTLGGVGCGGSF